MKLLSTIVLLSTLLITLVVIQHYIQVSSETSAIKVLRWWWSNGKGHAAVIFFSMGFLAFILLMSNSLTMVGEIVVAKPVRYVWIGAGLYQGSDYYYALDDPDKNRFEVKNDVGDFAPNFSTHLDRMYQIQTLMKYGPRPEDAQFWRAYNFQSQVVRVLLQYAGLLFGCMAVWQVLKQYQEAFGGPGHSFSSLTIPLFLLIGIQILALFIGNLFFQKKIDTIDPLAQVQEKPRVFKPGDTLQVQFIKKVKKRMDSGNKPFSAHYLVEWVDEQGVLLSAVIGFKATIGLRSAIKTLDESSDQQLKLECVIMDDFTLCPRILFDKNLKIL